MSCSCTPYLYHCRWVLFALLFWCANIAQAQTVKLTADSLDGKRVELSLTKRGWLFRPGDDIAWAKPQPLTVGWQNLDATNFGVDRFPAGWQGKGWFRIWVQADTTLTQRTLGFRTNHDGASEIYIDGVYRGGYGKVGHSKKTTGVARAPFDVISFRLPDTRPHLIAIRYVNFDHAFPDFIGFQSWLGSYERQNALTQKNKGLFQYMYLSVAAQLALALLHLFLFAFYPKQKLNLYYVVFSVLFVGTNWAVATENLAGTANLQLVAVLVFWISAILSTTSGWYLLNSLSNKPIPRWKLVVIILFTLLYLLKHIAFPNIFNDDGFGIAFLIIMTDGLITLMRTIKSGRPYIWLIGFGMLLIILLYFFVGADVFHLWSNYALRCFVMSFGLLSFPALFSIYLALDFARTNHDLSSRLAEVEELSAKALSQEAEKLELITHQAEKLERTVAERTAEVQRQADQLQELDQMKSRFFINLTHEFRTPLTLISGPAKQILSKPNDNQTLTHAETISRNADRLLQLINQLLDLSKLEAGKMELNNTPVDLVTLARRSLLLFDSMAVQKQIALGFSSDWDKLWLSIDQAKFEGIIYNLLSNAIKFTERGGCIDVRLVEVQQIGINDNEFELIVADTGIGIPANKMPYIFDRFYQVDSSDTRAQEGTGIGLAITKELTELMGGKLQVNSKPGEGTQMQVRLPIMPVEALTENVLPEISNVNGIAIKANTVALDEAATDSPLILVIEDNTELRSFISSVVGGSYRVVEAANGEEGLTAGLERIPDLVITDLMMPLMDGYQVCARLKENERTSHIPVIILTAKADTDSRITGLETRADAYLGKPFDQRELLATVDNLIAVRRQLREKYGKENIWLTDSAAIPSMEKVFLDKVRQAVETHLDDEQYSVDQLGDDIGLSRTQLHRKLKGLINQSPGELIRAIRLQRAYDLLKNKAGTVAEIGYMVGFGNPNNFSTSFSKHFGFAPSEAINN